MSEHQIKKTEERTGQSPSLGVNRFGEVDRFGDTENRMKDLGKTVGPQDGEQIKSSEQRKATESALNDIANFFRTNDQTPQLSSIQMIQDNIHLWAKLKGWWDSAKPDWWEAVKGIFREKINSDAQAESLSENIDERFFKFERDHFGRNKGQLLALMHSEISEALEAIRTKTDNGEPLADHHCPEFTNEEV